ncbi:hypothetical protein BD289DRAFT_478786 [Coniella lustricola]|uniref:Uncharacterized protein n=1 Tax=Coniella lustricola TaxID=2025994 RepID=A0A2T3AL22_9PEZI|nr:hypothetical protein BD289DRAFT_478786 [Coniella lustricola]
MKSIESLLQHPKSDTKKATTTIITTTTTTTTTTATTEEEAKGCPSSQTTEQTSFPDPPEYEIIALERDLEQEEEDLPSYSLEDDVDDTTSDCRSREIHTPPAYNTLRIHTIHTNTSEDSLRELNTDWDFRIPFTTSPLDKSRPKLKRCRDALKRTITSTRRIISNSHSSPSKDDGSSSLWDTDSETESLLAFLREDLEAALSTPIVDEKVEHGNSTGATSTNNDQSPRFKMKLRELRNKFTPKDTASANDVTTRSGQSQRRRVRVKRWIYGSQ